MLSVFQLALMGGAPIGSFAIGFAIAAWGPRLSMLFPGIGMLLVVAVTYLATNLWQLEAPDPGDQFSSVPKSVRS